MEYLVTVLKCYQNEPLKIYFLLFPGAFVPRRYEQEDKKLDMGKIVYQKILNDKCFQRDEKGNLFKNLLTQ